MEPIESIYIPPWSSPLPVTTIILDKSSTIAVLKDLLLDMLYLNAVWCIDSSLFEGLAGSAAVHVEGDRLLEWILISLIAGQVAEGEMEGILKAMEQAVRDLLSVIQDSTVRLTKAWALKQALGGTRREGWKAVA
ncbi:hypothetical protein B0H19DRAFT_1065155 [Mycena capillaripes]|nr:hypothetical protein B0H19DRAFT_1065155 [Mycena capillaripes]